MTKKITIIGWAWRSKKTGSHFHSSDDETVDLIAASGEGDPFPVTDRDALNQLCQALNIADDLNRELQKEREKNRSLTKQIRRVSAINRNIRKHLERVRA